MRRALLLIPAAAAALLTACQPAPVIQASPSPTTPITPPVTTAPAPSVSTVPTTPSVTPPTAPPGYLDRQVRQSPTPPALAPTPTPSPESPEPTSTPYQWAPPVAGEPCNDPTASMIIGYGDQLRRIACVDGVWVWDGGPITPLSGTAIPPSPTSTAAQAQVAGQAK